MPDQLNLLTTAPDSPQGGLEPSGRSLSVPARPTPDHTLKGYCLVCKRLMEADEATGNLVRHGYPNWDHRGRRGHCPGSHHRPPLLEWRAPI